MKKAQVVAKVSDYKNLYQGERCFILGNGPSLNKTNLQLLQNEYTFGCNKISLLYEKRNWHPSFYVMVSSKINESDWCDAVIKNLDIGIPCFLSDKNYLAKANHSFFKTSQKYENIYHLNCVGGRKGYPYPDEFWSDNIEKKCTKWGTILLSCIQIAVYMGFRKIYLLGCDLGFKNHTNGIPVNFDKDYNPNDIDLNGDNHSTHAHILAKRMCDRIDVKIYNATVGGSLEVYPRVNFTEIWS